MLWSDWHLIYPVNNVTLALIVISIGKHSYTEIGTEPAGNILATKDQKGKRHSITERKSRPYSHKA